MVTWMVCSCSEGRPAMAAVTTSAASASSTRSACSRCTSCAAPSWWLPLLLLGLGSRCRRARRVATHSV